MLRTSSPPADSLPKTALKAALPLVEIEGYVAQAYELCRYWLDDDNLVYSATLNMTIDGNQIILFRENVSGVDLTVKRFWPPVQLRSREPKELLMAWMARHVSTST